MGLSGKHTTTLSRSTNEPPNKGSLSGTSHNSTESSTRSSRPTSSNSSRTHTRSWLKLWILIRRSEDTRMKTSRRGSYDGKESWQTLKRWASRKASKSCFWNIWQELVPMQLTRSEGTRLCTPEMRRTKLAFQNHEDRRLGEKQMRSPGKSNEKEESIESTLAILHGVINLEVLTWTETTSLCRRKTSTFQRRTT